MKVVKKLQVGVGLAIGLGLAALAAPAAQAKPPCDPDPIPNSFKCGGENPADGTSCGEAYSTLDAGLVCLDTTGDCKKESTYQGTTEFVLCSVPGQQQPKGCEITTYAYLKPCDIAP